MSKIYNTMNRCIAIKPIEFKKIETELKGGLVGSTQRHQVIEVDIVMRAKIDDTLVLWPECNKLLVKADAGLQPWTKLVYTTPDGVPFVLCPFDAAVGFTYTEPVQQ